MTLRPFLAGLLIATPIALVAWIVWSGFGVPREPASAAPRSPADKDVALASLFESLPPSAKLTAPAKLYDEKGLFDYIDGAAPIFIERHFRRLAAAEVTLTGGGEVTADVYDMAAPENAASIFKKERSPSSKSLDGFDEAVASSMSLVFRQGRFYVKLTAFDAKGEAALPGLARALAGKMR